MKRYSVKLFNTNQKPVKLQLYNSTRVVHKSIKILNNGRSTYEMCFNQKGSQCCKKKYPYNISKVTLCVRTLYGQDKDAQTHFQKWYQHADLNRSNEHSKEEYWQALIHKSLMKVR